MNNIIKLKEISSDFRVLVVEDERNIREALVELVSKFFDNVECAKNGEEGLELYKVNTFDIVITDINMPKMNGLEMISEIKKINIDENIIVISAYSDIDFLLTSITLGIDGYIIKPINHTDIINLLYKICIRIHKCNLYNESQKFQIQLLEHLNQYNNIINKVAIVSKTDKIGIITYVNDFFCEVSGYSRKELIGKRHNITRHEDMSKSVFTQLWEVIQSGEVWEGTLKNKAKDGSPYFVLSTIIPLFDKNNTIEGYMGIRFLTTKDETERREFKKKVRTSYQEYKKSNNEAHHTIELLKEELSNTTNNYNLQQLTIDNFEERLQKSLSQITFYEKKIEKYEKEKDDKLKSFGSKLSVITDKCIELRKQITLKNDELTKLKENNEEKKEEVLKLNTDLIRQRDIIKDLRDTIKNIIEEDEEKSKESLFSKLIN